MCGIVGYITDEGQRDAVRRDKFMRQALIMDTLRGKDSTGVFGVADSYGKGDTPGWCKAIGDGFSFVESKDYRDFEKYLYKFCVGHNRAATIGDVTVENAHPFQEGPITMVHNGSLWSTAGLPKSQRELGVDVDSHAICHNLAIASVEEVVMNLDGAFALVWHDNRDDSLNIVRNAERPIHMAQVKNQKTILFMSEAEMLYAVAARLKIDIMGIVYPKPGQWTKFIAGDVLNPVVKDIDLSRRRYSKSYTSGYSDWWEDYDYDDSKWKERNPPATVIELRPHGPGGTRSPQPEAPDDNRIKIGGRWRPIPTRSQEMLLDLDYLVENRLSFVPVSCTKTCGKNKGVVSGYVGKDGITGIIYGMNPDSFERCKERTWTVRPLGVKYMSEDEPVLICRLVSTIGKGLNAEDDSPFVEATSPEPSKHSSIRTCRGAFGVYVTEDVFAEQIAGGCIQCQGNISKWDADELEWVNGGRDPMCGACQEEYRQRYGEVK